MNKFRSLLLAIVMIASVPASAQKLGYTFITAEYLRFISDEYGILEKVNGNGFSLDLSYAVRPSFAVTARLFRVNNADVIVSGLDTTTDINSVYLGVNVHAPLNKDSDFIIEAGFISGESNIDGAARSADADGSEVSLGFRTMQWEKLELNAYIHKNTIENETDIGLNLGAVYYARDSLSIDLDIVFDINTLLMGLGVTKYF